MALLGGPWLLAGGCKEVKAEAVAGKTGIAEVV